VGRKKPPILTQEHFVPVKVKICGVRTPEVVEAAVAAGADYLGIVFFPGSPRNVTLAEAALLTKAAAGRIATVAVLVDPDDALIEDVLAIAGPDLLQLHGREDPERLAAIKARFGVPVIKAIQIASPADVAIAERYWHSADILLFDAKMEQGSVPGGAGKTFDWRVLETVKRRRPFALSGGLTPENVGEAIRLTGAVMVDVSSGVERARGHKDAELVRRFIRAAKEAASEEQVLAR
jgi:phosphoribosylanthranilate isomerase